MAIQLSLDANVSWADVLHDECVSQSVFLPTLSFLSRSLHIPPPNTLPLCEQTHAVNALCKRFATRVKLTLALFFIFPSCSLPLQSQCASRSAEHFAYRCVILLLFLPKHTQIGRSAEFIGFWFSCHHSRLHVLTAIITHLLAFYLLLCLFHMQLRACLRA
jgi:hypothetical protein